MIKYELNNNVLTIRGVKPFSLSRSCYCGQAFRWTNEGDVFSCVLGRKLFFVKYTDFTLTVYPCDENDVNMLINYFDLEHDYNKTELKMQKNEILSACIPYASGIRIFNQAPFETLISFIISANNNIKRITSIIDKLCKTKGERLKLADGTEYYTFPTPLALATASESELHQLGTGYRDKYIIRTSQAVLDGFSLEELRNMPYNAAKKQLCTLYGVGGKVADCVLLFSLGHKEAFPMDVWIKRSVNAMFFDGNTPTKAELSKLLSEFGNDAGIIQQYIFHYARETLLK